MQPKQASSQPQGGRPRPRLHPTGIAVPTLKQQVVRQSSTTTLVCQHAPGHIQATMPSLP